MQTTVFDYRSYKDYLNARSKRGMRSEIAAATNCQVSYVSRVLGGEVHFSLEQADALNSFLGHSKEEAQFFLLLVQHARAGTSSLRIFFQNEIEQKLESRLLIQSRLEKREALSRESQAIYYSQWHYAAVHMLVSIEKFRTKESIAKYLGLPVGKVAEILEFLVSVGLVVQEGLGRFGLGKQRLHLEKNSPMLPKHHINWRMQAIRSLERGDTSDIHYSVLTGISDEDAVKIRGMLVQFIQEVMKVVDQSPQTGLHCFNCDFFSL